MQKIIPTILLKQLEQFNEEIRLTNSENVKSNGKRVRIRMMDV
jgi:hypothetical protein